MKKGFSIIELLVVMAIIAALVAIAIPAINAMQKSYDSTGAESMISTALATARTLAIKNGHYAGVRFQKSWKSTEDPLKAQQYMIFIIFDSDELTNWDCGFIVVEGYKPIKLPENVSVIDMIRRRERTPKTCNDQVPYNEDPLAGADLDDSIPANLDLDNNNRNITDISIFSIVFSPSGKLVSHEIRCGNKSNNDDVFNTKNNVDAVPPTGMFYEDNHDDYGIGVEMSRREFYLYDREKFKKLTDTTQRWDYLNGLKRMYVNPYTGEIIK